MRSEVTSLISTPRYEPVPYSSLEKPNASTTGCAEYSCAAQAPTEVSPIRTRLKKVFIRIFSLPEPLVISTDDDVTGGGTNFQGRAATVEISFCRDAFRAIFAAQRRHF